MSDQRHLTFIIVPHGDLETRTFQISYRKLKLLLGLGVGLLVVFAVMVSAWWYVAAQAARVPGLLREVSRLEAEQAKVADLARTLAEVEAQYERVRQLLGADAVPREGEPMLPPLDRGRPPEETSEPDEVSRVDGWPLGRTGYVTRSLTDEGERHPGLDIAVPSESYIRAAGSGTVRAAGEDEVYGFYVLIDHGGGVESMYGHASRLFVAAGDRVERHEVIALSGSTGRSTAPHLHFEIRRDGQPVDPLGFVRRP